jgi:hypothetical protein
MPTHYKAEECLDTDVQTAGPAAQKQEPLFRSAVGKVKMLSTERMTRYAALGIIPRRARKAHVDLPVCSQSFRATGITNYLTNGVTLKKAQRMACNESAETTRLDDRREDEPSLDELERTTI